MAGVTYGERVSDSWNPDDPGVMRLPSGLLVRGRGLSKPLPPGPVPQFAVYLLGHRPPEVDWPAEWLHWPDFRLPSDHHRTTVVLREVWGRLATERVELACAGGHGRTGTALACLAVLDGVPAAEAVAYVRAHYRPTAVETPWQRRYVRRWSAVGGE